MGLFVFKLCLSEETLMWLKELCICDELQRQLFHGSNSFSRQSSENALFVENRLVDKGEKNTA